MCHTQLDKDAHWLKAQVQGVSHWSGTIGKRCSLVENSSLGPLFIGQTQLEEDAHWLIECVCRMRRVAAPSGIATVRL